MLRKYFWLSTPFLLAAYPIIFIYVANVDQVSPDVIAGILAVSLGITALMLGLTSLLTMRLDRGVFITSLIVAIFFIYGHLYRLVWGNVPVIQAYLLLYMVCLFALIGGILFTFIWPQRLQSINTGIGGFVLILLLLNVATLITQPGAVLMNQVSPSQEIELTAPATPPDVYYIILDEYSANTVLKERLGYDNKPFVTYLRERGFYVADESRANYYHTALSLASSLNMQYLDFLAGTPTQHRQTPIAMVEFNAVATALKAIGYTYVYFPSGYRITDNSHLADITYAGYLPVDQRINLFGLSLDPTHVYLNDFHITLGHTTLLAPFIGQVEINHRETRIRRGIDDLIGIAQIDEPTFTLAHFILPHPPYSFRPQDMAVPPDGSVDGEIIDARLYAENQAYIDQVIFTNRLISQTITRLIDQSETPPIIVLQGDHGYRGIGLDYPARTTTWQPEDYYNLVLPILNAYYLPDGGDDDLYSTISPVNSFRLILNAYFDADLPMLPDRHFYTEDYFNAIYAFEEFD